MAVLKTSNTTLFRSAGPDPKWRFFWRVGERPEPSQVKQRLLFSRLHGGCAVRTKAATIL